MEIKYHYISNHDKLSPSSQPYFLIYSYNVPISTNPSSSKWNVIKIGYSQWSIDSKQYGKGIWLITQTINKWNNFVEPVSDIKHDPIAMNSPFYTSEPSWRGKTNQEYPDPNNLPGRYDAGSNPGPPQEDGTLPAIDLSDICWFACRNNYNQDRDILNPVLQEYQMSNRQYSNQSVNITPPTSTLDKIDHDNFPNQYFGSKVGTDISSQNGWQMFWDPNSFDDNGPITTGSSTFADPPSPLTQALPSNGIKIHIMKYPALTEYSLDNINNNTW